MNTLSLCTRSHTSAPESSLMEQLESHTRIHGWIWSAGENQNGFWCEIFTPTSVQVFQGTSLEEALQIALCHINNVSSQPWATSTN